MNPVSFFQRLRCCSLASLAWLAGVATLAGQPAPINGMAQVLGAGTVVTIGSTEADGVRVDRVTLTGDASVTPPPDRPARVLFVDPNDDIVMVDFSGAGKAAFSFENTSGPALPAKYNNPSSLELHGSGGFPLIKGRASITITDSDSTTRLRVAAMGRKNFPDPASFLSTTYDGVADIARILIVPSASRQFAEVDAGNVRFSADSGSVGISASLTTISGVVSVGEIKASSGAVPALVFAGASDVRLMGGTLLQPNGNSVLVSGFTVLKLMAGTDANGVTTPAQNLAGKLQSTGSTPAVGASPSTTSFALGSAGSFTMPASGSPAPAFSVGSGTFPPWATLNAVTGVISGTPPNATGSPFSFNILVSGSVGAAATLAVTLTVTPALPPTIAAAPQSRAVSVGDDLTLAVGATGWGASYRWQRNGVELVGRNDATLTLSGVQLSDTALYTASVTNTSGTVSSTAAIVGVITTAKVIGSGTELEPHDIVHPSGNIYDQVALQGAMASITADVGQATRMSFIDMSDDIVQVEFAGAGTLTVLLEAPSGPAAPASYNQPAASYMKGHADIFVMDADETTNVSIFTVGRATAFDPTGGFNFTQPISADNSPANNGSTLFQGHSTTVYDGYADIAFIAIQSRNGKFGGLRTANVSYWATRGYTGVYAPGVDFNGPVYVHDITASLTAQPRLMTGAVADARVTGGSLKQTNGVGIQIGGITQLKFTAGSSSHGVVLPPQANQGRLLRAGLDVTSSVVVNP